jgi:hypothetical protein
LPIIKVYLKRANLNGNEAFLRIIGDGFWHLIPVQKREIQDKFTLSKILALIGFILSDSQSILV